MDFRPLTLPRLRILCLVHSQDSSVRPIQVASLQEELRADEQPNTELLFTGDARIRGKRYHNFLEDPSRWPDSRLRELVNGSGQVQAFLFAMARRLGPHRECVLTEVMQRLGLGNGGSRCDLGR